MLVCFHEELLWALPSPQSICARSASGFSVFIRSSVQLGVRTCNARHVAGAQAHGKTRETLKTSQLPNCGTAGDHMMVLLLLIVYILLLYILRSMILILQVHDILPSIFIELYPFLDRTKLYLRPSTADGSAASPAKAGGATPLYTLCYTFPHHRASERKLEFVTFHVPDIHLQQSQQQIMLYDTTSTYLPMREGKLWRRARP